MSDDAFVHRQAGGTAPLRGRRHARWPPRIPCRRARKPSPRQLAARARHDPLRSHLRARHQPVDPSEVGTESSLVWVSAPRQRRSSAEGGRSSSPSSAQEGSLARNDRHDRSRPRFPNRSGRRPARRPLRQHVSPPLLVYGERLDGIKGGKGSADFSFTLSSWDRGIDPYLVQHDRVRAQRHSRAHSAGSPPLPRGRDGFNEATFARAHVMRGMDVTPESVGAYRHHHFTTGSLAGVQAGDHLRRGSEIAEADLEDSG